jgi:hypothetical protein
MSIRITKVRVESPGTSCRHITDFKWIEVGSGDIGQTGKPGMVEWIDNGGVAYVAESFTRCATVHPGGGAKPYVRSEPNDTSADNLLSLPRF